MRRVSLPKHAWQPPGMGRIKVNVDAAVNEAKDYIGVGIVARDDKGNVLGAAARRVVGNFSPHVGGCLAVREGAWLSRLLGALLIETDAVNVVRSVYNPNVYSLEANVIEDICHSMNQASSSSVCYSSRKGNFSAFY